MRRIASKNTNRPIKRQFIPKYLDEFEQFDSIERVFQKLKNGEIEYQGEHPVILGLHGEYYAILPALDGWLSHWRLVAEGFNIDYDDANLVKLKNKLSVNMPLTLNQIENAYQVVQSQRAMFRTLPRDAIIKAANDVMRDIQTTDAIKELMAA